MNHQTAHIRFSPHAIERMRERCPTCRYMPWTGVRALMTAMVRRAVPFGVSAGESLTVLATERESGAELVFCLRKHEDRTMTCTTVLTRDLAVVNATRHMRPRQRYASRRRAGRRCVSKLDRE